MQMINKKKYLYNKQEIIIILVFFLVFIIYLSRIFSIMYDVNKTAMIFIEYLIMLFPLQIIYKGINFDTKKNNQKSKKSDRNIYWGILDNSNNDRQNNGLITRSKHRTRIIKLIQKTDFRNDQINTIFIMGKSGMGKSVLINYIKNDLEKNDYNVITCKAGYHRLELDVKKDKKCVIIFDNFQTALDDLNCKKQINRIIKRKKKVILIFLFQDKYLTEVIDYLPNSVTHNVKNYFLTLDKNDIQEYLYKIADLTDENINVIKKLFSEIGKNRVKYTKVDKKYILCELLHKVKNNQLPLIELECIGEILSTYDVNQVFDLNKDYISEYFDDILAKCDEYAAYSVMLLFSENEEYNMNILELATFRTKEEIKNGLYELLYDNKFLKHSYSVGGYIVFSPKHEYVSRKIRDYIEKKPVPNGQISYISNLKKTIKNKDGDRLKKLNDNYISYNRTRIWINACADIMLISIFALAINFCISDITIFECIQRILILLVSLPSTLYIYNYCNRIMYYRKGFFLGLTCVCGSLSILLINIFVDYWGFFMGGEIIILAISIFFALGMRASKSARKELCKDSIVFFIIGIVIILLSFVYIMMCRFFDIFETFKLINNNWKMPTFYYILPISYFLEFIVYAVLSVFAHKNEKYIMDKIGYLNLMKSE